MDGVCRRDCLLSVTDARAVCIGSGRFLRAVLVPVLQRLDCHVVLLQPRGTAFADACREDSNIYSIETIQPDGQIVPETIELRAVGSLARDDDKRAFLRLPGRLQGLRFVGFGVTDAGLQRGSAAISHLTAFLVECWHAIPDNRLSVLNTDNVPSNGDLIRSLVLQAAEQLLRGESNGLFADYLDRNVRFHNTMVDRLTSHAPGNLLTPRGEPWPSKTIVIEDCDGFLDDVDIASVASHVHVRKQRTEFERDHQLKLRLSNATSSALAYVMALARVKTNNEARNLPMVLTFRDRLVRMDLLPALVGDGVPEADVERTYAEWASRSSHPCFGLDNLWDALLRFKARLFSTIASSVSRDAHHRPSIFMAFVLASICRFLTPFTPTECASAGTLVGEMDHVKDAASYQGEWEYGGGLRADLCRGTYEFKDGADTRVARALGDAYAAVSADSPQDVPLRRVVAAVETALDAIGSVAAVRERWLAADAFVADVALLFQRLVAAHKRRVPMATLSVLADLVETPSG
ncbi:hypothetical protein ATCC90586_006993 [Pythium insidiosum]|nr:hypothetical protein ATCC90586_006993 [Pythium insidiosum]